MSSVKGKVVAITGGGTGIGAAVARRYADDGAHVVVVGRRRLPLDEVASETGALAIVADASARDESDTAISDILAQFGRLDTIIANAGGGAVQSVVDTDDEAWAQGLQTNLTSAFVFCRAALPALVESGGQIVIVSSIAGLLAGPSVAGYTVAKHALIGLTRSIARDYGPKGVRANAICPGWVRTPMADEEMGELAAVGGYADIGAAYAAVTAEVPLGRPADSNEIASAIRFLGSGDSSYMTGSVLVVDGGAHMVDVGTLAFSRAGL